MDISRILLITKSEKPRVISYNDKLEVLNNEEFEDLYTLNFFLQMLLKQNDANDCLLIIHDTFRQKIDIKRAQSDEIFFE